MNSMQSVPQQIAPVRPPVVVTVVSKKGGSGKTSTIMVLASAAAHLGLRVHILDGDRDPQLVRWQANAEAFDWGTQAAPQWPQAITAEKLAATIDDVATQLNAATGRADLVLIDTRPGHYADTEDVAYLGDVILIPSTLAPAEVPLAIDSYRWMVTCRENYPDDDSWPVVRVALSNLRPNVIEAFQTGDVDKLTEVEFQTLKLLLDIPALGKPIPASRIVENMPSNGPLNAQHDALPVRRQSLDRILAVGTELVTSLMSLERATR